MNRTLALMALIGCTTLTEFPVATSHASGGNESAVSSVVATLLNAYHYEGRPVDDTVAKAWMEQYLNSLDFTHMIFLASDVEEFRAKATTLDDDLNSGKPALQVAKAVYARYEKRLAERIAYAQKVLEQPLNLDDDEEYHFDRKNAPYPKTVAEADELWRQRIEEQFILGAQAKRTEEETREMLKKRYHRMKTDQDSAEPMDMLERYLTALTTVYDPHTIYFKPASQENFDIEMQNSLEGIGATLRSTGPYTVVMGLVAGGPAEKGGQLQVNDKIIAVGQGGGEPEDVIDLRIDKVVKQIRGKKGTEVRLTVIPADAKDPSETRVVKIVRDKVVLADSDADFKIHEVGGKRLAVIDIPSFYADPQNGRSASRDLERILTTEMGKVDGVIIDFRQNGGGSLQEAVDMTGLFIKKGPVVQIRDKDGTLETLHDRNQKVAYDGPLIVLTSPLSASASEIVAGAIQDYGRGLVVGSERSHGKGSVQTVIDLNEMMSRLGRGAPAAGALKLTRQKFYRINGESTQVRGVRADIVLPSPWDGLEIYEGDLDHVLKWDEIAPLSYTPVGSTASILPALRLKSEGRIATSEDFKKLRADLAKREVLSKDKVVSLNLKKRLAESVDSPVEDDDAPALPKKDEKDPVLDEALAILVDTLSA